MAVYQMNTDNCLPTTDTIIIVSSLCDGFTPEFPTVITPNLDGKNDIFVIDYLDSKAKNCRWEPIFIRLSSTMIKRQSTTVQSV